MERLSEVKLHPFGKDSLRSTGVQYSDEVTTTDGEWTTVESVTVTVPIEKKRATEPIVEVELGITWAQKSSGASKYVRGRVQGRNTGGTWVTLIDDGTSPATGNAYQETAADASSYTEYTYSGRYETVTNFNQVNFDLQVQVQREDATEEAVGKVKGSSYVRVLYSDN
ncbi:MAG: hypothetical protein SVY53_11930 [Chloroflexota bacterium]|nr:hypothetical protein [Chloroflexota bacterium]